MTKNRLKGIIKTELRKQYENKYEIKNNDIYIQDIVMAKINEKNISETELRKKIAIFIKRDRETKYQSWKNMHHWSYNGDLSFKRYIDTIEKKPSIGLINYPKDDRLKIEEKNLFLVNNYDNFPCYHQPDIFKHMYY